MPTTETEAGSFDGLSFHLIIVFIRIWKTCQALALHLIRVDDKHSLVSQVWFYYFCLFIYFFLSTNIQHMLARARNANLYFAVHF